VKEKWSKKSMNNRIITSLSALCALLCAVQTGPTQGSLTPPGAPAPTMKSLDQIEPRIPVDAVHTPGGGNNLFIISQSGSYYLATNLTAGNTQNAIFIATNGVTLDLNGFTLSSTSPSAIATGVLINSGLRDITIFNGHIKSGITNNGALFGGNGFGYGIYYLGTSPVNTVVSGVTVSGVNFHGINIRSGYSTVVKDCVVNVCANVGIYTSTAVNCMALNCYGVAITGQNVLNCYGASVFNSAGISAGTAENCQGISAGSGAGITSITAHNCYGQSDAGSGLSASAAENCIGVSSLGDGLDADIVVNCEAVSYGNGNGIGGSVVLNCYASSLGGNGIYANPCAQNCRGGSNGSGYGIYCLGNAQNCYADSLSGIGL
jgi:hypothetical protein